MTDLVGILTVNAVSGEITLMIIPDADAITHQLAAALLSPIDADSGTSDSTMRCPMGCDISRCVDMFAHGHLPLHHARNVHAPTEVGDEGTILAGLGLVGRFV